MTRNPIATSPWLTGITRGWNLWLGAVAAPVDHATSWRAARAPDARTAGGRRAGPAPARPAGP
jgi:hypothetical protein